MAACYLDCLSFIFFSPFSLSTLNTQLSILVFAPFISCLQVLGLSFCILFCCLWADNSIFMVIGSYGSKGLKSIFALIGGNTDRSGGSDHYHMCYCGDHCSVMRRKALGWERREPHWRMDRKEVQKLHWWWSHSWRTKARPSNRRGKEMKLHGSCVDEDAVMGTL